MVITRKHIKNLKDLKIPLVFLNSTFSRDQKKPTGSRYIAIRDSKKLPWLDPQSFLHPLSCRDEGNLRNWKKYPSSRQCTDGESKDQGTRAQDISILKRVDHVVSISKSSENLLIRKGCRTKKSVIFNGLPSAPAIETDSNDEHILLIKALKRKEKNNRSSWNHWLEKKPITRNGCAVESTSEGQN